MQLTDTKRIIIIMVIGIQNGTMQFNYDTGMNNHQQEKGDSMKVDCARIVELMKNRKITQKELSRQTLISVYYLSKIVNNEANPKIKTVARIAKVLGVSVSDLILSNAGGDE